MAVDTSKTQEPTLVKSDKVLGDEYAHPAFGSISAAAQLPLIPNDSEA